MRGTFESAILWKLNERNNKFFAVNLSVKCSRHIKKGKRISGSNGAFGEDLSANTSVIVPFFEGLDIDVGDIIEFIGKPQHQGVTGKPPSPFGDTPFQKGALEGGLIKQASGRDNAGGRSILGGRPMVAPTETVDESYFDGRDILRVKMCAYNLGVKGAHIKIEGV